MPLLSWIILIAAAMFVAYKIVNGPVKPRPDQWNPSWKVRTILMVAMVLYVVYIVWFRVKRGH